MYGKFVLGACESVQTFMFYFVFGFDWWNNCMQKIATTAVVIWSVIGEKMTQLIMIVTVTCWFNRCSNTSSHITPLKRNWFQHSLQDLISRQSPAQIAWEVVVVKTMRSNNYMNKNQKNGSNCFTGDIISDLMTNVSKAMTTAKWKRQKQCHGHEWTWQLSEM